MKFIKQLFANVWGSSSGLKQTPSDMKIQTGWIKEKPKVEYMNWLQNRQDTMLAYINQQGIVEWDNETEYQEDSSYVQYGDFIYRALQTGSNKQPDTETTYWKKAFAIYGDASETFSGTAELATQAETNTGTDDARIVTPAKLNAYITQRQATESLIGAAEIATTPETNAGSDDSRIVTPLKLKGYLDNRASSETVQGTAELATQAETNSGTDDARIVTPLKLKGYLDNRASSETVQGTAEIATQVETNTGSDDTRIVSPAKLNAYITQRVATETSVGGAEVATQAETNALSADDRMITPAKLGNGFAASFGASGYIKLPFWLGGFMIQWGTGVASSTSTINFPASFPTACYVVVGSDAGNASHGFGTASKSTTGFILATDAEPTLMFNYIAIGV